MDLAIVGPTSPLAGRFRPPSDKSISQRALLLAALAAGESELRDVLECEDTVALRGALASLGIAIEIRAGTTRVTGPIPPGSGSGPPTLDVGESGTAARLLLGALAGRGREAIVTGRGSLKTRPMRRVVEPLRRMGAEIEPAPGNADPDRLPLLVRRAPRLEAARFELPVASAQVKSAILLAALGAPGETAVVEPFPSRDHTERLLPIFAVPVATAAYGPRREARIVGPAVPRAARVVVPGDPSSALYAGVLALLVPGSRIVAADVCLNPTRTAALDVLARMGAAIERLETGTKAGEQVGDLTFRASELVSTVVAPGEIPALIDDVPILAVAAAAARTGVTRFSGAAELRLKESDRLATTVALLRSFGNGATIEGDALVVPAGLRPSDHSILVDCAGDHRIAASAAIAALATRGRVSLRGFRAVAKSYPGLLDDLRALGARGIERESPS